MTLTSTRFLRRPSRLPGQPFRLASKDLLPWAYAEPPIGDRHDDLAAHDLPLQVGIPVILASAVVGIAADRFVRG